MKKKNILLLSLLSLGFANSTAPEQAEQSTARPHIQFVKESMTQFRELRQAICQLAIYIKE